MIDVCGGFALNRCSDEHFRFNLRGMLPLGVVPIQQPMILHALEPESFTYSSGFMVRTRKETGEIAWPTKTK